MQGWTPLMIAVLIMGGVQMLMLGVIGEYLWRTLDQVRNRDAYIVEQAWGGPAGSKVVGDESFDTQEWST